LEYGEALLRVPAFFALYNRKSELNGHE
jgi:hypothetical protein